jgi:hypothetical protein
LNNQLIDFYGDCEDDHRGRSLREILNKDDMWWEAGHDFIQWVFPTMEPSAINPHAPLLDVDTIVAFRNDAELRANLERSLIRFMRFLRVDQDNPWWVYTSRHNCLRITRALDSVNVLSNDRAVAMMLYKQVHRLAEAHPSALKMSLNEFWTPAMEVM